MLGHCVAAGMSSSDFWDSEIWEVNAILQIYFKKEEQRFQQDWEIARFQLSGMVDTKRIKFPWELQVKRSKELTPQELEKALANKAVTDQRAKNEHEAVKSLLEMGYAKHIAREKVIRAASYTKKVIDVQELINNAING
jgi:hypothetical protein